ncbi:MAG TPA: ABC transporter ATP-binding protein [Gammaproteobacteria bacterium]|nr:ABC transporter ATP-binding protein [Gammaproteobacteria bacterium]
MIKVTAISRSFLKKGRRKERIPAVNDVSFTAIDGQITGLLGANGAGKSTTLRVIAGLLTPDSGDVAVDELMLSTSGEAIKTRLGFMPHNPGIYPRLTARENIEYFARLSGLDKALARQRTQELIDLLGMQAFAERRTEGFSQGQKTKVALSRALVHKPKNLILDEPSNGLDVMATRSLRRLLMRLRDQGHCILISSHIMQEVTAMCDKVAIIHRGQVVIDDTISGIHQTTGQDNFENAFVVAIGESLEEPQ